MSRFALQTTGVARPRAGGGWEAFLVLPAMDGRGCELQIHVAGREPGDHVSLTVGAREAEHLALLLAGIARREKFAEARP